jgi:hypothetical protein
VTARQLFKLVHPDQKWSRESRSVRYLFKQAAPWCDENESREVLLWKIYAR